MVGDSLVKSPSGGRRARKRIGWRKSAMGGAKQTFQLVLIKPTHYDDDGYPITWLRSHIPSNTLAALYGLAEDCRKRAVLGPDVDIVAQPIDETNARIRVDRIVADIERSN